jgi:putative heme-binding domain-containing protein
MQRRPGSKAASVAARNDGQQLFATSCGSCHGLDGRGSLRAPNLVTTQKAQQTSDARLTQVIQDGVPSAGMPAFRSALGEPAIRAIVNYLHVLQGRQTAQSLPGNPQNGKMLFFGKGRCAECHAISGEGGFIGPDLSQYALFKAADEIRSAILEPGKNRDMQKSVALTTQDNQSYKGVVRNEDNFSLQLQTLDGAFHLFMKSDLKNLEYQGQSLMPSDYGDLLTKSELDDLVSFLVKAAHATDGSAKREEPHQPPRSLRKQSRKD